MSAILSRPQCVKIHLRAAPSGEASAVAWPLAFFRIIYQQQEDKFNET